MFLSPTSCQQRLLFTSITIVLLVLTSFCGKPSVDAARTSTPDERIWLDRDCVEDLGLSCGNLFSPQQNVIAGISVFNIMTYLVFLYFQHYQIYRVSDEPTPNGQCDLTNHFGGLAKLDTVPGNPENLAVNTIWSNISGECTPKLDISWRPSQKGVEYLRGFFLTYFDNLQESEGYIGFTLSSGSNNVTRKKILLDTKFKFGCIKPPVSGQSFTVIIRSLPCFVDEVGVQHNSAPLSKGSNPCDVDTFATTTRQTPGAMEEKSDLATFSASESAINIPLVLPARTRDMVVIVVSVVGTIAIIAVLLRIASRHAAKGKRTKPAEEIQELFNIQRHCRLCNEEACTSMGHGHRTTDNEATPLTVEI